MPTEVLLMRHGQSEWNAIGRWQGQADSPLTDLGRAQARAVARSLPPVEAIVASDLSRAHESAEIIATELGIGPVIVDADLRERNAGEWSGLTRDEIHERYPGYLPDDRHRAFAPDGGKPRRPPGWESDGSLFARAARALDAIAAHVGDARALAVTHGGLIYAVEGRLGQPVGRLANGEARWISVDAGQLVLGDRVLLASDSSTPVTVPNQL